MKVIIATGGTGGHLFPALWVAETLRNQNHDLLLVGSFSIAQDQIKKKQFAYIDLGAKGMRFRGIIDCIVSIGRMGIAFCKSLFIIGREKPHVVLGFGGYGAFPVVLAAKLMGCPTIIHEQNVTPGRANSFLGKIVDKIAISFKEAEEFFDIKKVVLTGCPCHSISTEAEQKDALAYFGFKEKKFTVLVFGGSQGSTRINEVFCNVVAPLSQVKDFQVIHVTGEKDIPMVESKYETLEIPWVTYRFLERMDYAYGLADMVISRAGAVTISEIIKAKVPSVLVPYPYAARDHQKMNAEVLSQRNLATLIEECDLNEKVLETAILQNFEKIQRVKNMDEVFSDIGYTDSSERLAKETLNLIISGEHKETL